jgi:hypothetical protein
MVASFLTDAAEAARGVFRAAYAEALRMAEAIKGAAAGLAGAGVVGDGLKEIVSATIPSQATPAVANAQGPPGHRL